MYASKVLKPKNKKSIKWNKVIFYSILIAVPVIQISLFYIYVNFSSFLMAFRSYSLNDDGILVYSYSWANLKNFEVAWKTLTNDSTRINNTFIYFAFHLLINIPLALFSSYYLYKKKHASGFFKVMLFMPQVLSSIVLGFIYTEVLERAYPFVTHNPGLLFTNSTAVGSVILFNLVMSFGVNVLIYTSAMGGINESLIESSQLDGCNSFTQFIFIILPMIYPTIVSLLIVSISSLFTNQYNVFILFGNGAGSPATTNIGHYLYSQNLKASYYSTSQYYLSYPELSALGLILTGIILPISLFFRWALNRFGPRVD